MKALSFSIQTKGLAAICFFLITACSHSNMKLAKNEPLPEIVKIHKSLLLAAKRVGLFNTGVYLENDDLYTILATGSIDMAPRGPLHIYAPEDGWPVMARIGKDGYAFQPIHRGYNSGTRNSYTDGELFIGYRDREGRFKW